MNEQHLDMTQGEAEHLLSGGVLNAAELAYFYRRVIQLCQDYAKDCSELAQLKHKTRGVVYGDMFRESFKHGMENE